jgi:voltage-gated potassium channel Kch
MWILGTLASLALLFLVLLDGFEAMVLPRQVVHRFRFARLYYRGAWAAWRWLAQCVPAGKYREAVLSRFGPLSLIGLFICWLSGLVVGFALLNLSLETRLQAPEGEAGLGTYLYLSGITFFTVGYGEVTPTGPLGRLLAVIEAGTGLGFLALIIGYMPVLYQAFSRREAAIALLDARAGSPPSAAELLRRVARSGNLAAVEPFLAEWERWAAELLESSLSFPVLSYYRSQHDNQSWLAALTTVLDTCALLMAGVKGCDPYQAQLTFAMARHAAVDLALVLRVVPEVPAQDRLPPDRLRRLRNELREAGLHLREGDGVDAKLTELREMYESFVTGVARRFLFNLPVIVPEVVEADNWQRSAWMRRTPGIGKLILPETDRGWHD